MQNNLAIFNSKKVITDIIFFNDEKVLNLYIENLGHTNFFTYDPNKENFGVGWFFESQSAKFVPAKPNDSWVLNESKTDWIPPVPKPIEQPVGEWFWHEDIATWVDIVTPEED